jgi:VanZ family protein
MSEARMSEARQQEWRLKAAWRGSLWGLCLAAWTAALLTTAPAHVSHHVLAPSLGFPISKALHIGAYAFLTMLLGSLPIRGWRWFLLACLSLHACATEYLQQFVPLRTGCVQDVLIDHLGIALGLALSWNRWCSRRR